MKTTLLLAASLAVLGNGAIAQHADHAQPPPKARQLGTVEFANSGNAAAQTSFIEGVKLLHNFDYPGAQEAFRSAQAADPDMVLAYWGEAMAHNETLWSEQTRDGALKVLAKLGPTPAARAAKAKTPREAAWLDAVETLYGPGTKFERDGLYADKMDALVKAWPDTEAIAFAALATLGRSHGTRDVPNYERAGAMLEPLFAGHPDHPGIAHYLIHSYDDPAHAAKGLAAAHVYDKLAPDSPHAQHMVSHIYLALGMWPEVEQANLNAAAAAVRNWGADPRRSACGHGGLWRAYARIQQGVDPVDQLADCKAVALEGLAKAKDISTVGFSEGDVASAAEIAVRRGIELGQWDEPLVLPPGKLNYARFVYLYGEVFKARQDPVKAAAALGALRTVHAALAVDYPKDYPDDQQMMPWLDLALAEAEAVAMLAAQDLKAMGALRAVAEREKALPAVFGPPILFKPSWELLGDELMGSGQGAAAVEAYKQSLALQPGRRHARERLLQLTP